jgi:hemolysin III
VIAVPAKPAKPRLRGWSHLAATVPALVMTVTLVALAHGHMGRQFALLVYGASSVLLFAVSGIYHTFNWAPPRRALLRRLDHANIFLLVAGTYTPVVLTLLSGAWMITLISVVWAIAVVGIALVVPSMRLPRQLLAGLYVTQGWVAIIALPVIVGAVGGGGMVLILTAGGLYTLGAFAYAFRWPTVVKGWFEYHEVFHVFVIAANAMFFSFMVVEVAGRP